jgi:methylthioribose-1-phosphate isomerase
VPYTVIADNTGGHLMQHGMVDMVIVGSDRTTRNGDVANKIGTYLKALAAADNNIPFYVALPTTSIDPLMTNGIENIPIEQRDADELTHYAGLVNGAVAQCELMQPGTPVANYGFDVTPARLVTALITEKGICDATEDGILQLFG